MLRGFSEATIACYSRQCDCFLEFCKAKDTSKLTEKEFRAYLLYLTDRNALAPSSYNQYNSAIRFLYEVTLEKDINYKRVPHVRKPVTRPEVLTPQESWSSIIEKSNFLSEPPSEKKLLDIHTCSTIWGRHPLPWREGSSC